MMTDSRTLAYINMYAVLGAIENLCELDKEASDLVKTKKPVAIGLDVTNGPSATLIFKNGRCRMEQGIKNCDVLLPFSGQQLPCRACRDLHGPEPRHHQGRTEGSSDELLQG